MSNWIIADPTPEHEKIKAELVDHLNGLRSSGKIDYATYSELYDLSMQLMDDIYELGKKDRTKT